MGGARKAPGLRTRVPLPALRPCERSPVRAVPPPAPTVFRARPWYDPPRAVSPIMCVSRHASEGDAPALPLRLGPPHRTGRGRQPTPAKTKGAPVGAPFFSEWWPVDPAATRAPGYVLILIMALARTATADTSPR